MAVKEMTVIQFAKRVRKTRMTVFNWVKKHQLPTGVTAREHLGRIIIQVDDNFGKD